MNEIDEKVARLPAWARGYINRLKTQSAPIIEEVARARREVAALREQNRQLRDRIDAMLEIFQAAAKGDSVVAKEVVSRAIETWIISDHE